jgi:hypothetical protein
MGTLHYGPALEVVFDDRVLAHLQLVIGAKLRRKEGFFFSWRDDRPDREGRSTIWLEASISLLFRYSAERMPVINREWLDVLSRSSNSAQGLLLTDEVLEPEPAPLSSP